MLLILLMWGQPPSAVRRAQPGRSCGIAQPDRCERTPILALCRPAAFSLCLFSARLPDPPSRHRPDRCLRCLQDATAIRPANRNRLQQRLRLARIPGPATSRLDLRDHRRRAPPASRPPPCWDVLLTPSGVDTVRALVPAEEASKPSFIIPVARRELVAVTGISKQGNLADVDFTWKWVPLNEIGAALYSGDLRYKSTVGFRRVRRRLASSSKPLRTPRQTLDDALKNAEPAP